jgi:probable HAF family extracellular repeat protein
MDFKGKRKPKSKKERVTKMNKISVLLVGLMACLAIGISTAQGQKYSLEDLGIMKGMEGSQPAALNNNAHVAGTAHKGSVTCAFYYDNLKKFMEDAGGVNSRGFGINSMNVMVGDSFFAGPMDASHAALFKGGFAADLGVLKGKAYSRANSINTMGQVVGFSSAQRDGAESRAFLWSNQTGMVDIGTLGGGYAQAYAINEAGVITGSSQTQGMGAIQATHAFIYRQLSPTNQRMQDLGVLGGFFSSGMAINNYNHVAGFSTIKSNNGHVHAFFHDGRSMMDLGTLSRGMSDSDYSVALGVNNKDQVVGYTYLPAIGDMPLQQVAFLWNRTGSGTAKMVNLNNLLNDTGKGYVLISATAINDYGQIVASAYDIYNGGVRSVLLTPVKQ